MTTSVGRIHIRHEGTTREVSFTELGDIGPLSPENDIKDALASYLECPRTKLNNYTVAVNEETGDVTFRPQAEFGQ